MSGIGDSRLGPTIPVSDGAPEDPLDSRWRKIEAQVAKESALALQWLILLILINAGLVAAFAQTSAALTELAPEDLSSRQAAARYIIQFVFLFAVPVTGILSSGFILFAITASADQFQYLRERYMDAAHDFESRGWPRPFGDENEDKRTSRTSRLTYWIYGKPTIIPRAFQVFWIVVLVVSFIAFVDGQISVRF